MAFTTYDPPGGLATSLGGLTLGLIPFPTSERTDYEVHLAVVDEVGDKITAHPVKFRRKNGMWVSVLGPLGCLPIPGRSLRPRETLFLDFGDSGARFDRKAGEVTTDSLVEALVIALKELPRERLAKVRQARQAGIREVGIEGRSYWYTLAAEFSKGIEQQEKADQFTLLVYGEKPRSVLQPREKVIVARRNDSGHWQPVPGYLKKTAKSLVSVTARLENGIPAHLVVTEVSEPALEDFLLVQTTGGDLETVEAIRWGNKALLQAKDRSLPGLLQRKSTRDLLNLIAQVEESFAELNQIAATAKDQAQQGVAGGGTGGTARELALTCQERDEILKPILAALKQEVARRGQ
ncbi:hypothetical protein [Geomonas propionica]|uniref:Uncharacterized protein n=1 Tax=Geomonas propionica TaxID=2798582 RepID=A0ABS0YWR5_9BACT|nr:hypothetical protein [Geomonas propionica]MBJ6802422.1 hypothetical protein [Geomonas propionica]